MKTNGSLFWRQAGVVATLSVARILDAYAQPPKFLHFTREYISCI